MSRLPFYVFLFIPATGLAGPDFTERLIDAGFDVEQPVLIANLTGGDDRQIVLAGRDEHHVQRLAIYSLGQAASTEPLSSLAPGPNLIAFDVGRLGDEDALFFIEPGRVLSYDFASGKFVEVVQTRTIYGPNRSGDIVPIDFFRDVNLDGRDDLIVPDTAGYRVRLQREDGSLGEEVVLEESSSMTVLDGVVSFESRPLFNGDMNFDGLIDLVVWRGDSLRVYLQLPGDRFQGKPEVLELGLDLLSEAELLALQGTPGSVDQSGLIEKRIFSIEDRNGDQVPDILIESAQSSGVFDKRNDFRLHLGRRDGDHVAYREQEDTLLSSEGLQYGLVTTDIDGDGKKDLLVRKVRITFGRVIRALLSGNVPLGLHFFRMTSDDDYAEEANYIAKTNVRFSVTTGHMDIPAIRIADFDGDGLQDLMMQTRPARLSFFAGRPTSRLFAADATDLEVELPRNGNLVDIADLNGDDRSDLVIRYNGADGIGAARKVRLLITRP
ncbi:MAG: hypothetical protein GWP02_07280 [Desulfobulbaceae bacterium]|nr:hypothetical protein [Desulfobulbaceae bacterium]